MPLLPDLKVVFVHIPKNAGRSIEQALLGGSGSPDGGRRSLVNRLFHAATVLTAPRFARTHLIGSLDQVLVAQHLTYGEMDLLGLLPGPSEGYATSFAVCRNPFDRAVSSVSHFADPTRHGRLPQSPEEFERALFAWLDREPRDHNERAHRRPQVDYVLNRYGERAVEHVLRYETLGEEFAALMAQLGHPEIELPWRGSSDRSRDYRDYFTPASRQRVERAFGRDLDAFQYAF